MEEDDTTASGVVGHAFVSKKSGLTVGDLRVLLAAVHQAKLPDDTPLYVRTKWGTNKHGVPVKKITAASPE